MPKLWINDLSEVNEAWHPEYEKQSNGKYKLKGEDFDGIDDPQGMKRALGAANSESGNRRKSIERWEKLGKTPEEIEELLTQMQTQEQQKLEQKGQWDTLKTQMVDQHNAEKTRLQQERDQALADADNFVRETEVTRELAAAKGNPRVLLPHVNSRVKVERDDQGKRVLRVLGEDGKPRINGEGNFLKISDLIGEMRKDKDFAAAFEGPNGHGGGAAAKDGGAGGTPAGTEKRSTMSREAKTSFIAEHGSEAYLKLPA